MKLKAILNSLGNLQRHILEGGILKAFFKIPSYITPSIKNLKGRLGDLHILEHDINAFVKMQSNIARSIMNLIGNSSNSVSLGNVNHHILEHGIRTFITIQSYIASSTMNLTSSLGNNFNICLHILEGTACRLVKIES